MTQLTAQIELYATRDTGGGVIWRVTQNERGHISTLGVTPTGGVCLFEGPAYELQAWCAKRNIPYQHVTLNVPVELEI